MTGRGGGGGRRVLLPPINFLFRLLQQRSTVQIWLYEQLSIRIVGTIRVSPRGMVIEAETCRANKPLRDLTNS